MSQALSSSLYRIYWGITGMATIYRALHSTFYLLLYQTGLYVWGMCVSAVEASPQMRHLAAPPLRWPPPGCDPRRSGRARRCTGRRGRRCAAWPPPEWPSSTL